jgi:acetylornithine/succinyldiaminopimelate/putrescine aminotransferase
MTSDGGIPDSVNARRLTWSGHEFLDAARNDTNWQKISKKIRGEGLTIGFELLKTVLVETAKDQLKTHGILPA